MKTCYIFGASKGFDQNFAPKNNDLIIAADGGFKTLQEKNITPGIVLGDFDSLGYVPEGLEVIKHPVKKNDTDTLLAIKTGFEKGYKNFVLYGCTGGRLDHTIANIQSLCYISKKGGNGILYGEDFTATAITDGEIEFSAEQKGVISVFSAETECKGVTIKGLLYETDNALLSCDFPLGVSNEFIGKKAKISVKHGTLIIIVTKHC